MPEGPSIVILRELAGKFKGRKVLAAEGNTQKIDIRLLEGKKVTEIKSWGKHFLICFSGFTIRIHFLLYGSYVIDGEKESPVRLGLRFSNGTIRFYACSVRMITAPLDEVYDWSADVLSSQWDPLRALQKLRAHPDMLACDALLDQEIFAGVGNIIKNEILFRIRLHPESITGKIPLRKLKELVAEGVRYSQDFLAWKKEFTLKKHYQVYRQAICPRDQVPLEKRPLGKYHRRSFYCPLCQTRYV